MLAVRGLKTNIVRAWLFLHARQGLLTHVAGAACDVPAHNYTYSFAPKTDWTQ